MSDAKLKILDSAWLRFVCYIIENGIDSDSFISEIMKIEEIRVKIGLSPLEEIAQEHNKSLTMH